MTKSVEGIYRDGKVEVLGPVPFAEGSRVIVTIADSLPSNNLRDYGIDEAQAANFRHRLSTMAEDWDSPEMSVYDDLPPT